MFDTIAHIIIQYREGLISGILVSLALVAIVWTTGLVFGVLFGWWAHQKKGVGSWLKVFWFLISSSPILVILFWLHFPLQAMLGVVIKPFITAAAGLSVVNIVFVAAIIKDSLDGLPKQYFIAGKVSGLSEKEIFTKIKFPLMMRAVIPQLLFLQVAMLQATIFASLISVEEIFRVAQRINSMIYKPVEIYTTLALFFIAICLPLNVLAYWLKKTYTRNHSEK
ncbi:MAG: ABC transporter permease subunit [Patescibacteria group bacterium]|jgi:ABC-type amino acid transport system permease subunit